ncbi:MAG: hypothetical protein R6X19_09610 [Kiritimatiellia bacterium]
MKSLLKTLSLCAAGCLLAGCLVRSPEPWLPESTRTLTPSIGGTWQDVDQKMTILFSPSGSNYHALVIGTDTNVTPFSISLHQVDNALLMTVSPVEPRGLSALVQLPVHLLFKAELVDNTLRLFAMDLGAAETRFKTAGASVRFWGSKEKGFVVLATTPELTAFVRSQLTSPGFFNTRPLYQFKRLAPQPVPGAAAAPPPLTPPY